MEMPAKCLEAFLTSTQFWNPLEIIRNLGTVSRAREHKPPHTCNMIQVQILDLCLLWVGSCPCPKSFDLWVLKFPSWFKNQHFVRLYVQCTMYYCVSSCKPCTCVDYSSKKTDTLIKLFWYYYFSYLSNSSGFKILKLKFKAVNLLKT